MLNSGVAGEVVKGQVKLSALAPEMCAVHFKQPVVCTAFVWSLIERAVQPDLDGVVNNLLWLARKNQTITRTPLMSIFMVTLKGDKKQTHILDDRCH